MAESKTKDTGPDMNEKKLIYRYLLISLVIHILFLAVAAYVKFPKIGNVLYRTKRISYVRNSNFNKVFKKAEEKKTTKNRGVSYANQPPKIVTQTTDNIINEVLEEEKNIQKEDVEVETKELTKRISSIKDLDNVVKNGDVSIRRSPDNIRKTRNDIVGIPAVNAKDGIMSHGQLLNDSTLTGEFSDKMPGFTPKGAGGMLEAIKDGMLSGFSKQGVSAIGRKTKFGSLGEYLICEILTYKDPIDSQKYYKISIRAGKDAENLGVLSKNIVFLVDSSLSMQSERLEEFKKGLEHALKNLNAGDKFNIIAFRDKMIWFKPESVSPEPVSIKEAVKFIGSLEATEVTDSYEALHQAMLKDSPIEPSYIMLLSDGRPTYGVTDAKKIISDISAQNDGQKPVFAFSGGARVNRYFLDFISYKNRGWTEYADRAFMIGRKMSQMYDKIKDPMLLNLRYRVSGVDFGQIYPKSLPDFFRGAEFTLYGKYTDENKFSIQLLGDAKNETNEFLIVATLSDAKPAGPEIAREWAFNKIYYLIGLLEYQKDNSQVLKEINDLCDRFDIKTPYTEGIKE